MKEDVGFEGNQITLCGSIFLTGYVIGMIPSNYALLRIRPRYFFPTMMIIWGGLTMLTATVKSPESVMVIRFFLGVAESSTFVGSHFILGSWYTREELGKRSGLFTSSGLAGAVIGGFIQTGIHHSMDGLAGLAGWRWLFIVDGFISLPVALFGYLMFPDTPETADVPYLSEEEKELALRRIPTQPQSKITIGFIKTVLTSKYWWGFVILCMIAGETESFGANHLLALTMKYYEKERKYTIAQLNNLPSLVKAVSIVSTLFWATLTDIMGGKRYIVGYWIGITGIATSIMILFSNQDETLLFVAYYWSGYVYACQATFFAWANDAMRHSDSMLRSVVIASMNTLSAGTNVWWAIVFYSADEVPYFTRGMYAMIVTSISLMIWCSGLTYMTTRTDGERRASALTA